MFVSILELLKIGIGPSSSHTTGPMVAAKDFLRLVSDYLSKDQHADNLHIRCVLKGSLAYTGKGHATDRAVTLGLHGFCARELIGRNIEELVERLWNCDTLTVNGEKIIQFCPDKNIVFDFTKPLPQHPNGMIFELLDEQGHIYFGETYFSIGGGFVKTLSELHQLDVAVKNKGNLTCRHPFESASEMLEMASKGHLSISQMKRVNEQEKLSEKELNRELDFIWQSMRTSVENGLAAEGVLPGGLELTRRAKTLYEQLQEHPDKTSIIDWLSVYAIAVSEENAAGHMVVTAPTNGAAGVVPAILYYLDIHEDISRDQIWEFLLTASAIGGLIKHRSSISGAEVGCQGEIGSAAAMAAAGLCAVRGGTPEQIENAAEIALEHHLGMTCDPVKGLVQVPCIERNGFGAVKAYTAASLALKGNGYHFMPLDNCIAAMKQTGVEMSVKFRETSLGGLAVTSPEC